MDLPTRRAAPAARPALSLGRAWWLTAFTIGWNMLEAIVAITSGTVAGSIALVGFGLDSVVEVSSALVVVWLLARHSEDEEANERAERRAVRLIAGSFVAIALFVTFRSFGTLLGWAAEPEPSLPGLVLVVLSLIVMPVLALAKRRTAASLGSMALRADAANTQLCTYLSAVVLVGLAANGLFGWWWMDSLAGLVVAGIALHEAREAWQSGDLCAC